MAEQIGASVPLGPETIPSETDRNQLAVSWLNAAVQYLDKQIVLFLVMGLVIPT